jgi:UPF0042 nucleotide-binding protein
LNGDEERGDAAGPDIVIITGMSGAGRSTAAKSLEDLDWFVADNLPPGLLPTMIELGRRAMGAVPRIAAVMDVRSRAFTTDLQSAIGELAARGGRPRVVFLEASDDTLVRRFESVRRPHPLQGQGRMLDGITRERTLLGDLRSEADVVIDTSGLNVHQLSAKVSQIFAAEGGPRLRVAVMSFGFKYGIPLDADLVFDLRFLPNPFWVPELRSKSGKDPAVADYVLRQEGASEFLDRVVALMEPMVAGYLREGRRYVTLAVGCTGGKHRSVAMSEQLADRLTGMGIQTTVVHRDLGRE